jgi:hypothetical protein
VRKQLNNPQSEGITFLTYDIISFHKGKVYPIYKFTNLQILNSKNGAFLCGFQ